MAGIGFELRRLARRETLSSQVAAAGHAAVVAAGPWIFTILSLALITLVVQPVIGIEQLSVFRILVIYAFAVSLVMAAPVTIVATRLLADALWLKRIEEVRSLLFASCLASIAVVVPPVLAINWAFAVPPRLAISLLSLSSMVALIWVALSFAGAVRDYVGVTLAFLFGLLLAVAASIAAAVMGLGPTGMAWGFLSGLTVIFIGLTLRVLATFPHPAGDPVRGLRALLGGLVHYRHLALGALAGTIGVWIDKWVFWFSDVGERLNGIFVHAPIYDSATFIASLAIIPSLAAFVTRLETGFFDGYQSYYGTIQGHGTADQIEEARQELATVTQDNLVLVTAVHAGLAAVMILLAPAIVDVLNLQFRQIAILRYGTLGGVFHFVLIATTSLLVFFDRRMHYLLLQLLFLALNFSLTLVTLHLGEDYFGVGYFLACLIVSFIGYVLAVDTLHRLNYLTFIGNNPSITIDRTAIRLRALKQRLVGRLRPRAR